MTPGPIAFIYLAFELNALLDRGCVQSIETTRQRVDDGSVFDWLDAMLESQHGLDGTPLDPHVREAMLKVFRSLNDVNSLPHFGVEHNGVALLVAYCIEGIQQNRRGVEPPCGCGHSTNRNLSRSGKARGENQWSLGWQPAKGARAAAFRLPTNRSPS